MCRALCPPRGSAPLRPMKLGTEGVEACCAQISLIPVFTPARGAVVRHLRESDILSRCSRCPSYLRGWAPVRALPARHDGGVVQSTKSITRLLMSPFRAWTYVASSRGVVSNESNPHVTPPLTDH